MTLYIEKGPFPVFAGAGPNALRGRLCRPAKDEAPPMGG